MAEVNFITNVLLKNILGKDLINDDNIAVLELVKNSYDAGAQRVEICFRNIIFAENENKEASIKKAKVHLKKKDNTILKAEIKMPESVIIISDDGAGMDKEDIEGKWLNIAYSEKKEEPIKLYPEISRRRYQAGNKGVGRFSCDRLGEHLDLYTKTKNGKILHLEINWKDFEKEGLPKYELQRVPLSLSEITFEDFFRKTQIKSFQKGTILYITKLRSTWGQDKILSLRKSLEQLINPNQAFQEDVFSIFVSAPDYILKDKEKEKNKDFNTVVNGEVENKIFSRLKFKTTYIESFIDSTGGKITTCLFHRGSQVYKLIEENNEFIELKDIKIVIYYLNQYKKIYFSRETKISTVDFGSIFLFINGFRVPPYGTRGDDWIGLDNRKTQGVNRFLGTRDVIGRIEVNDLEGKFKTVSSREGLVKDEAVEELIGKEGFYYKVHKRLEKFIEEGIEWDKIPKLLRQNANDIVDELDEIYSKTEAQKQQLIIENLSKILGVKDSIVVSLEIDKEIIRDIVEQETKKAEETLSFLEQYNENGLLANVTSLNLKRLKELLDKKERKIQGLEKDKSELQVSLGVKEEELSRMIFEKNVQESEIFFLKSLTPVDKADLIEFLHSIRGHTISVKNLLGRLVEQLEILKIKNNEEVLDIVGKISLLNQKIGIITNYSTKANFRASTSKIKADFAGFVQEYIENVRRELDRRMHFKIKRRTSSRFLVSFKPIEISMLIDNLLSNSRKAEASNIEISFAEISKDQMEMSFQDDGRGLSPEIVDSSQIFRRGFSTTTGSGIGLNHVQKIIKDMGGTVTVERLDQGVKFIFRINLCD